MLYNENIVTCDAKDVLAVDLVHTTTPAQVLCTNVSSWSLDNKIGARPRLACMRSSLCLDLATIINFVRPWLGDWGHSTMRCMNPNQGLQYNYYLSFSYMLDNYVCKIILDVEGCTDVNSNVCEQLCDNTRIPHSCFCYEGYQLNNDGFSCRGRLWINSIM